MAKKRFEGKVVVITGASSGIGEACAYEFSRQGASVILAARNTDKLEEITSKITSNGGKAVYSKCDVSIESECEAMIENGVKVFGGIDIIICNAGLSMRALFDDVDLSVLHKLMDVNFWGCVNCTKFALPYIQKSKGSIVGVSSIAGIHGLPARTGYSSSKYAMVGFLDTIRVENMKKGVHVMVASPGFVSTNVRFTALTADGSQQGETPRHEEKMMTPNEVARRIMNGICNRKRSITMDFNGKATTFLKKISPKLVDIFFYNAMAKEPDSPLK